MTNVSDQYGQLALQGPNARRIIQDNVSEDVSEMGMFEFKQNVKIFGKNVILSQSGYTGEDGFEIYCDSEDVTTIWDALYQKM